MRLYSLLIAGSVVLFVLSGGIAGINAFAKDHSGEYQMGTFILSSVAQDGTITSTLHGDGTTTAGSVYANQIAIYKIQVADGIWLLNTYTQNKDSMIRNMGMTPMHLKSEKSNPLDALKDGDRVLFRVEKHHLLNGVETSIFIPYADNPDKEFRFIGYFTPSALPASLPAKPVDNVKAMCEAHKLSPELEKQYCPPSTTPPEVPVSSIQPSTAPSPYPELDAKMVENTNRLTCSQIKESLLSNPQVVESLLKFFPKALASIRTRCPTEAQTLK
jgi:hypothetical protein